MIEIMEKDKIPTRLESLDGLRGFAIILVFLNHINTSFISPYFSPYLFGWLFSNGVTGVTLLFILSGFLMSYLYAQPASPINFLQKRYTRIFPLFLTMCAVMMINRLNPDTQWYSLIGYILLFAVFSHILWVYVVKKLPSIFGKSLFFFFLLLQVLVGLLYSKWIMRHPPVVFSQLPFSVKESFIGLVNGTLTLPLGDYIPMIDGVYWTLVAEVLFYIVYPFLFAPLASSFSNRSKKVITLFIISLLPLFGGIYLLSQKITGLSLIQPELFYYFVTGVTLGTVFKKNPEKIQKLSSLFVKKRKLLPLIIFFVTMAGVHSAGMVAPSEIDPWIRLLFAIPLTFLIAMMLNKQNILSQLFSKKGIVFIGTISYSLYLCHALIIHLLESNFTVTNTLTNILYVTVTFLASLAISYVLFYLLEKPYFKRNSTKTRSDISKVRNYNPKIILGSVLGIYLLATFAVYSSSLNFFSISSSISKKSIISPKTQEKEIFLSSTAPLIFEIEADQNRLGVITMRSLRIDAKSGNEMQTLQFYIKEKDAKEWYASSNYSLDYFEKEAEFPFGFPQIENSKGKKYIVQLSVANPKSTETLKIYSDDIAAVYPVDKKELLKNPANIFQFFIMKLSTVVNNTEARLVFLYSIFMLPFILLKNKRNKK